MVEDPIFEEKHKHPVNLNREFIHDPRKGLENIRHKNMKRLIFEKLNVNSLRNKVDSIQVFFVKIKKNEMVPFLHLGYNYKKNLKANHLNCFDGSLYSQLAHYKNFILLASFHVKGS